MRKKNGLLLPLALGALAAVALAVALWPHRTPTRTYVVAARDLGAGTTLQLSDLTTKTAPASEAPRDAVTKPESLAGKTLAVVRFAGEPITPKHLGPAVSLKPDERGIAVTVKTDTGAAGLLRPGMKVGVVATVRGESSGDVYSKVALEGLKVLYVPPTFQARPYEPVTLRADVTPGKKSGGGLLGGGSSGPVQPLGSTTEGVVVLAASVKPVPLVYDPPELAELRSMGVVTGTTEVTATVGVTDTIVLHDGTEVKPDELPQPTVTYVSPVELLAALNAQGRSLTLVLMPQDAERMGTTGVSAYAINPTAQAQEEKYVLPTKR